MNGCQNHREPWTGSPLPSIVLPSLAARPLTLPSEAKRGAREISRFLWSGGDGRIGCERRFAVFHIWGNSSPVQWFDDSLHKQVIHKSVSGLCTRLREFEPKKGEHNVIFVPPSTHYIFDLTDSRNLCPLLKSSRARNVTTRISLYFLSYPSSLVD